MTKPSNTACLVQDRGLIPRVFQELFAQIQEKQVQQVGVLAASCNSTVRCWSAASVLYQLLMTMSVTLELLICASERKSTLEIYAGIGRFCTAL